MKRIICIVVFLFSLTCCTKTNQKKEFDYDDYKSNIILFDRVFSVDSKKYYVYLFSKSCLHCNQIKDDIFKFIDRKIIELYLLEYYEEIPINYNVENTIGVSNINGLFFRGTPSVVEIVNHVVSNNIIGSNAVIEFLINNETT